MQRWNCLFGLGEVCSLLDGRTRTCGCCNDDGRDDDATAAREMVTLGSLSVDTVAECFASNNVLRGLFGVKMTEAGSKLVGLFDLLVEEDISFDMLVFFAMLGSDATQTTALLSFVRLLTMRQRRAPTIEHSRWWLHIVSIRWKSSRLKVC